MWCVARDHAAHVLADMARVMRMLPHAPQAGQGPRTAR
jgi:hypothetical protein